MSGRRGFLLVVAMLLCLMLVVMGMGFLGKRGGQYQAALEQARAAQARALAEAGIEDAMLKLNKDLFFPPPGDGEQTQFSYSEELRDVGGELVGTYFVTVDSRRASSPDPPDPSYPSVFLVESRGVLGKDPEHPLAVVRVRMEVDLDEGDPQGVEENAEPYRITDWHANP